VRAESCRDLSRLNGTQPTVNWDVTIGAVIHPNGIYVSAGKLILEVLNKDMPIGALTKLYCEDMTVKDEAFSFRYRSEMNPIMHIGK